jgi:hypothetical protein
VGRGRARGAFIESRGEGEGRGEAVEESSVAGGH